MRWLHLSDIHFKDIEFSSSTEELRDSLESYILSHNIRADYLFITGDFRYAKNKIDNLPELLEKITAFISRIAKSAGINNMDKVILVPGNHDLNRLPDNQFINDLENSYRVEDGYWSPDITKVLLDRFSFFYEVDQKLHPNGSVWTNHMDNRIHKVMYLDEVNLLMLNTAVMSNSNDERGKLILNNYDLYTSIQQLNKYDSSKPIIVLGHHSLEMFSNEEARRIENIFKKYNIPLYLCGDAHKIWYRTIANNTLEITMGYLSKPSYGYQTSFSSGMIENGEIKDLKAYQWDYNLGCWGEYSQFNESILNVLGTSQINSSDSKPNLLTPRSRLLIGQDDYKPDVYDDIKYSFLLTTNWIPTTQNEDGGLPTDAVGSESCVWTTCGLLWSYWVASGTTPLWWKKALRWILSEINADGGIPVVRKNDYSITDATAQGLMCCIANGNKDIAKGLKNWLVEMQLPSGGWKWCYLAKEENFISTGLAILSLLLFQKSSIDNDISDIQTAISNAKDWIISKRNIDGGWGSYPGDVSRPANTGYMMFILSILGHSDESVKSLYFLKKTKDRYIRGWEDSIDRPASHSVTRLGNPYVALGLSSLPSSSDRNAMLDYAFKNLLQGFDGISYTLSFTIARSWPTRDFLTACSSLVTENE